MATNTEPWGQTPLTAEGLASLDHPLSLTDFNQDAGGYWRIIRGQKTYYPREWFDDSGTFTGTGTQAGDPAGQDKGFFHTGMHWNWDTGQWENPTNWANVIGVSAAGGVGGAFAAPFIAGAAAGGGAAGGGAAGGGAVAGGTILKDVVAPGILAGTSLINTREQVAATEKGAQAQADAAKYAADVQAKAAAESLAFQRQQAAYNAQVAESTRAANYGQWAAKQTQLGSVGQALGLPARAIPAYVPLPPDASLSPGTAAPGAGDPGRVGVTDPGQGGSATATAPPAGANAAWWNPQDPKGSVAALFGGAAPTSQAILDRRAQIEAAGGQVSPANAEGVTSKIYLPGVGWTRILDGGVAGGPGGGQGTGWTFVPQTAPGAGGGAPGATAPRLATGNTDALGSVQSYFGPVLAFQDPAAPASRLTLPRYQPYGGPVGSYL
jgi:hypothetical protein